MPKVKKVKEVVEKPPKILKTSGEKSRTTEVDKDKHGRIKIKP